MKHNCLTCKYFKRPSVCTNGRYGGDMLKQFEGYPNKTRDFKAYLKKKCDCWYKTSPLDMLASRLSNV